MIILVLSRFLELIKSIDKRVHKIEIIPLNYYRHHDESAMQSENELRATDELKSDLKDMRHKLNLLEEEINKIEKSRPSSGTSPVNEV